MGQPFSDLLATLGRAPSPTAGLARALKDLVALSGATSGGLVFQPGGSAPLLATAGTRPGSVLDAWMRARLREPARGVRLDPSAEPPPGRRRGRRPVILRVALGEGTGSAGRFLLLGPGGRRGLSARRIPPGFPRELGLAMEQAWRLHRGALRLEGINEVTAVAAATLSLERIYQAVADAVGRLIRFDELGVTLIDRERAELRVLDVAAPTALPYLHDVRIPIEGALESWVADHRALRRLDDASDPTVPRGTRELLARRGSRSAILAPLVAHGELIGTLNVTHEASFAFTGARCVSTGLTRSPPSPPPRCRSSASTRRWPTRWAG